MAIKHAFTSPKADGGDATLVRPGNWNADHAIDDKTIAYAKIQDVSATDKLLGRSTAGAGVIEEIACTAAGRALLDDANAAAQRTTLGLGTAAVENTSAFDPAGSAAVVASDLATHEATTNGAHGMTVFGASLVDDANAGAARTTLGLAAIAASGSGADLGAGTVTLAKLANVGAQRVVGSVAGGTPAEITANDVLDFIAAGNGSVLGRVGGVWSALGFVNVDADGEDLVLADHASTPTAPGAGATKVLSEPYAGRRLLGSQGADGIVHTAGPYFARSQFIAVQPNPGTNNHLVWGSGVWTFVGTPTARTITASNNVSGIGRMGVVSATSTGSIAAMRLAVLRFYRGDATGRGGFHLTWHWAITDPVLVADARMFCGLWGSSGAPTDVNPSTLTQIFGIGCDGGDTQLQVYGAAGVAQTRTALGANFPVTADQLYEVSLYSPPGGAYVGWQVARHNTGHTTQGTITDTARMPTNTQFLAPHLWRTNNATAAACSFDWWSVIAEATG